MQPIHHKEIAPLLNKLKEDLMAFPNASGYLDLVLESATKHIPAYLKIVKGHIDQLAKVLELETHDHRKLENVGLAEPVTQLIQLFRDLDEQDMPTLEKLSFEARHWQHQQSTEQSRLPSRETAEVE